MVIIRNMHFINLHFWTYLPLLHKSITRKQAKNPTSAVNIVKKLKTGEVLKSYTKS